MISNKTFYTSNASHSSSKVFKILNGLQQGTVNSPILFNIYVAELLRLFDQNTSLFKRSIAFADDLIIYITHCKAKTIIDNLQELFEKIQFYFHSWKLKINASKCETILFRPPLSEIGVSRRHVKAFQIREKKMKAKLYLIKIL